MSKNATPRKKSVVDTTCFKPRFTDLTLVSSKQRMITDSFHHLPTSFERIDGNMVRHLHQKGNPGSRDSQHNVRQFSSSSFLEGRYVEEVSFKDRQILSHRFRKSIGNIPGGWSAAFMVHRDKLVTDSQASKHSLCLTKAKGVLNIELNKMASENRSEPHPYRYLETLIAPHPWQETWERSLRCTRCWKFVGPGPRRLECYLCPNVEHQTCYYNRRCFPAGDIWICGDCEESIHDDVLSRDQMKKVAEKAQLDKNAATKLQSLWRSLQHRFRFIHAVSRALAIQRVARGYAARKQLRARVLATLPAIPKRMSIMLLKGRDAGCAIKASKLISY
jgi:hypothetical protein